jgi:aspartate ammonia-lyase
MTSSRKRVEHDSLGSRKIPADAYYGIQTDRAVENYPISGLKSHSLFIDAYVSLKKACAIAHARRGTLDSKRKQAIVRACDEILGGKYRDSFVVDIYQMGAGTSTHMNVNEVIANRANEILRGKKGVYDKVNPNDHVNMGQSTNDTYPTAMRVSALWMLRKYLYPSLTALEKALVQKGKAFDKVLKSGRTHLQDAVPIRLGQEFKAYGRTIAACHQQVVDTEAALLEIGLGGSAAGTGLNTLSGFASEVTRILGGLTGLKLKSSPDLCEAMQSQRPISGLSAALRNLALEVNRISNDLRLLSSGPMTGLSEISLPAVAPGSSIMPGKVNPSIPEMVNMVCYQVLGCDATVAHAVQAGQLELNVLMPVMSCNVNFAIVIMGNALKILTQKCVIGIQCNRDRCQDYALKSMGVATALNPHIGYARAAEVAKEALRTGQTLVEVIRKRRILSDKQIRRVLNPHLMTAPSKNSRRS